MGHPHPPPVGTAPSSPAHLGAGLQGRHAEAPSTADPARCGDCGHPPPAWPPPTSIRLLLTSTTKWVSCFPRCRGEEENRERDSRKEVAMRGPPAKGSTQVLLRVLSKQVPKGDINRGPIKGSQHQISLGGAVSCFSNWVRLIKWVILLTE